jgi:phenylacetate-coenzyme A ligase PaaK-like adenylate-forming protein
MAIGMVSGRRLDPRNIERLVEDALATLAEFGEPGADAQELTDGPLTDPVERSQIAMRNVRRTARRLATQSPFYARRFAAAAVKPDKLDAAGLAAIPVTVKGDLVRQPDDFRCADVPRYLATRTTGTTGRPAEIWLSRYEMELWPAIAALAAVLRDDFRPTDVMQVNISSRATAAVTLDLAVCRLIGTGCRLLGCIPPDEALDSLGNGGVTLLNTSPSYLGQLVVAARRRGMGPDEFRVRRIDVGGEILSPSLARAAASTFGGALVNDQFGMTEVLPVTGRTCSQGHLHHDVTTGLVEYLDLETGEPAAPGALATAVITPYFPFRECMPVFRYDTRDVVRRIADEDLTCEVAGLPATTKVLGKADQLIRLASPGGEAVQPKACSSPAARPWEGGFSGEAVQPKATAARPREGGFSLVTPREVVEAVEALPSRPWPARFRVSAAGGRLTLTLPEHALAGLGHADAVSHFADRGLAVDLRLVPDDQAGSLRKLRCDLRETTFVAQPSVIGA